MEATPASSERDRFNPNLHISTSTKCPSLDERAEQSVLDSIEFSSKFMSIDRYTKLAARIFKVERAGILMIDDNRTWLRTRFNAAVRTPANSEVQLTHFISAMLESSPDIMIIQDTLEDARYMHHPCVRGEPRVRFCAGVAITVNGVRIGSLSLVDCAPRPNFSLKNISMLLDLAGVISSMVQQRQANIVNTQCDVAGINMSVLYNLRYPLRAASNRLSEVCDARDEWAAARRASGDPAEVAACGAQFAEALCGFTASAALVHDTLEACLNLASKYVEATSYGAVAQQSVEAALRGSSRMIVRPERCELAALIGSLRGGIEKDIASRCAVQWIVEADGPSPGAWVSSFPDVIRLTLMTTLAHIANGWKAASVHVSYLDASAVRGAVYGKAAISGQVNARRPSTGQAGSGSGKDSAAMGYIAITFQCAQRRTFPAHSVRLGAVSARATPRVSTYNSAFDDIVLKNIVGMVDGVVRMKTFSQQARQTASTASPAADAADLAELAAQWSPISAVKERYDCYIPCFSSSRPAVCSSPRTRGPGAAEHFVQPLASVRDIESNHDHDHGHASDSDSDSNSDSDGHGLGVDAEATRASAKGIASRQFCDSGRGSSRVTVPAAASYPDLDALCSRSLKDKPTPGGGSVFRAAVNFLRGLADPVSGAKVLPW